MTVNKIARCLLLLGSVVFVACKGKAKDLIVNKWKMIEMSGGTIATMSDSTKKDIMDKATLEFTKDGKYAITGIANSNTGTYTISNDGKLLQMQPSTGEASETSEINEITEDKLVLTGTPSGSKIVSVPLR